MFQSQTGAIRRVFHAVSLRLPRQCFNPKLVRLEEHNLESILHKVDRFQSQTGAIRSLLRIQRIMACECFNPKLVRLEDICDETEDKVDECFNPKLVRLEVILNNVCYFECCECFNPKLVRLEARSTPRIGRAKDGFNPKLVRLEDLIKFLINSVLMKVFQSQTGAIRSVLTLVEVE